MENEEKLREYLKRVTADLRRSRQRVRELEAAEHEPVAIVGMACRFPGGVASPEDLWRLVSTGGDAIGGFPDDRGWDVEGLYSEDADIPGTSYVRGGGFLDGAAEFDPGFFGISPREALAMDPQQRLLLEISWEAIERAAISPASLRGGRIGVFVGAAYSMYTANVFPMPEGLEGHLLTGNVTSAASGRISYTLGFEGPAVTVDTACSSSLVALHLAIQALRSGECTMALAGGVTVMTNPSTLTEFSRQRGLAADGRCKAFAAAADGFGSSEGVGMLLVERLSDARRAGHRVLAVVRGTAVNQDGASNGLTAPNGPSQRRVIKAALANALLTADQVDAVEAHGTGTPLGDPIEAQALLATYGQGRAEGRPLLLGSVKSNIGHTQAAAGVAGVIKMVMAMRNGLLPETLHVDEPTPHVDWTAGAVELLTQAADWPETGEPRRAAVSSFGISGTNAHVILEQAPTAVAEPEDAAAEAEAEATDESTTSTEAEDEAETRAFDALSVVPWVLSGRGEHALTDQAVRLEQRVAAAEGVDAAALGAALLRTRSLFEDRAVVLGSDLAELAAGVTTLAQERSAEGVVFGTSQGPGTSVVFVFPGQGSQWVGMATELMATSPVFRESIEACERALAPFVDWSLTAVLAGDGSELERVDVVQPVLFAVMVSLAAVWRSLGVEPAAVVGHSQGEIAAAYVAGALSLDDAARVVALRSKEIARIAGTGGMVSLFASRERAEELLTGFEGRVGIAAVNGPGSVVVSGLAAALDEFMGVCAQAGVDARRVNVDYASHSAQMEDLKDEVLAALAPIVPGAPRIPMFSTYTASWVEAGQLGASYWYENLRHPVRLYDAVCELARAGHRLFVESSPHPVLTVGVQDILDEVGGGVALGTLRREQGGARRVLTSAAQAFVHGAGVDWERLFTDVTDIADIELPTYAFQRDRYWLQGSVSAPGAAPTEQDAVDAAFWAAVENNDFAALTGTLGLAADQPISELLPALSDWRRGRREASTVDSWRYRIAWRPVLSGAVASNLSGVWLLVCAQDDLHGDFETSIADALRSAGAQVVEIACDPASADRQYLGEALAAASAGLAEGETVSGVVSLLARTGSAGSADPVAPSADGALAATLALIQAVAVDQALGDAGATARLWCVSCGGVSVGRSDAVAVPSAGLVWGLGRVAALEIPERWGALVDLPAVVDARVGARLAAVLAQGAEDQVAVRGSGIFGARLEQASATVVLSGAWSPVSGSYLITGGTGALGGRVARWLAARGAEHLILLSRRGADAPGAAELVAELEQLGVSVAIEACDASDRDALSRVIDGIPAERPLAGVFHVAGVIDDGVLESLTPERLRGVLDAKAVAAWHLHELTRDLDLSTFVLFSSLAGTIGAAGQGNYAAANAYLDALARYRRGLGLAGVSVGWGPWAEEGLAADGGVVESRMRRGGLVGMASSNAMTALERVLIADDGVEAVADVAWERFAPSFISARPSALLAGVVEALGLDSANPAESAGAQGDSASWVQQLAAVSAGERLGTVVGWVRGEAAGVLGFGSADAVGVDRVFRDLGFDSLTGVELRNRLARLSGLRLPAGLVFDYPSPRTLGEYLAGRLAEELGEVSAGVVSWSAETAGTDDPVVVVGMACRFPGGVTTAEGLWQLLAAGGDGVGGFPVDRGWGAQALAGGGGLFAARGGFVGDVAGFDGELFGISPREALAMDPQQRVLLESVWEVFEGAGIDPVSVRGSRTGVFMGTNGQDYGALLAATGAEGLEGHLMTGNAASVVSGRVSYVFGLEGPAVTVDTACSSSLVALHLAAQALKAGECDAAVAGGVTVMATPGLFAEFATAGGLAADGRCKAFGAGADGTVWGEGVGVLLLERASVAQRLGHKVLAVVRGSAVNQDGASNGLTAPNGPSQQRVIRQALASAGLTPGQVDVVEAHGTGTALGDPIEAEALIATYGREHSSESPVLLGSIKSNIGHTQAAAGVAGVMKMVLAMRAGLVPKTLHVDEPSPEIDWDSSGLRLALETEPWPGTEGARRAGVSSFGISGTNAHVILEVTPDLVDEDTQDVEADSDEVAAWALSARSRGALRAQAARLIEHLAENAAVSVEQVGFTLASARAVLGQRAVLVGDRNQLIVGLDSLAAGRPAPGLVTGSVSSTSPVHGAVLFSGQGSQRPGAGRALYETYPVFADALDAVCAQLDPELDRPLREVLFDDDSSLLDQTQYTQAGLFALEVALYRLVESWGVAPGFVAGHSIGELTAAYVAGVWSLEDACRLVAARGRLMQALPSGGGMLAVQATEVEVAAVLVGREAQVSIAAINGPNAVVVSGVADVLDELEQAWRGEGRKVKKLAVSHAFHSPLMEPMLAEFRTVAESLTYGSPSIPVVSNMTGQLATAEQLGDPGYWVRHVREAVRFADGVGTLRAQGVGVFLELGPDGVLTAMAGNTLSVIDDAQSDAVLAAALRSGREEHESLLAAVAALHVTGLDVDWTTIHANAAALTRVDLPTYAFQHERYWPEINPNAAVISGPATSASDTDARFWDAVEREDFEALAATVLNESGDETEASDSAATADTLDALRPVLPVLSSWRRKQRAQSALDAWRYRVAWNTATLPTSAVLTGTWLLVSGSHTAATGNADLDVLAAALRTSGADVVRAELDTKRPDRLIYAQRLRAALGMDDQSQSTPIPALAGVLSFLALDDAPLPDLTAAVPAGLPSTVSLIQALGDLDSEAPLWCATQGAVSVGALDRLRRPHQAAIWGLGRSAALEYPERWGGLIDLPATVDSRLGARLGTILAQRDEDQLALRDATVFAARLQHAPAATSNSASGSTSATTPWRPAGTVLITGGTGGLGSHVARTLARDGAEHLLLLSRRGPDAVGARELADELTGLGAQVTIEACDVADRAALARVLADIPAHHPDHPLTAVIHTAAVLDDGVLDTIGGPDRFATVLGPKADAARHLHELTVEQGAELTAFVLFSSIAGIIGGAGQAAYCAANAVLDALAEERRAAGLPATSIAWGPWAEGGMVADSALVEGRTSRGGLPAMSADRAIAALEQAVRLGETQLAIVDVDWARFAPGYTTVRPSALLTGIPEARDVLAATAAAAQGAAAAGPTMADRLATAAPAERERLLADLVCTEVALVLGHASAAAIDPQCAFKDMGFDSLTAVELRNRLSKATGARLTPTLVFDYPTPVALTDHLGTLLVGPAGTGRNGVPSNAPGMRELDALEAAVRVDGLDDGVRVAVTARLQILLAAWGVGIVPGAEPGTDSASEDLDAATDDEIFDFIGKEFGIS